MTISATIGDPILAALRDGPIEEAEIELALTTRTEQAWTVLDVGGEIDLSNTPQLRERLVGLIDEGHDRLMVNLQEVPFMDSTGIGVLVGALKRTRERGGDLVLAGPQEPVLKVLRIVGLDRVFTIQDSVARALEA